MLFHFHKGINKKLGRKDIAERLTKQYKSYKEQLATECPRYEAGEVKGELRIGLSTPVGLRNETRWAMTDGTH